MCNKENCGSITNSLIKTDRIDKVAHLVVVLNQPKFTDTLSYHISGNLIFQQDGRNVTVIFPTVEISAFDATTHSLYNYSLPNGDTKDIIMAISCSEETKLVIIFPKDWLNSFDSTFEILCSFTKVNVASNCRKLFVAHRLSPSFDDSLLVFHASKEANIHIYNFTVYSRNENSLLSLLHHMYQNIPGVLVIPELMLESYIQQNPDSISKEHEASKLMECIKKEINSVKVFLREHQSEKHAKDRDEFHQKFADMQRDTDLHYLRLFRAICQLPD